MNLKLVTYEGDYSQFLINTASTEEAVQMAIEANLSEILGPYDNDIEKEIRDPLMYSVEEVLDMNFLFNLIKRDSWSGIYNETIVFNY